jgi:hypothetical protein
LPAATGGATGAPSSDGSSARPFEVFAEFELSIVTTVPVSSFALPGGAPIPVAVTTSGGAAAQLGISPMRVRDLASVMSVALERFDELNEVWVPMAASLAQLAANLRSGAPTATGSRSGTDAYPIGAWGIAAPANLTDRALPTGDVLFAGNRLMLVAEARTMTVGPEIDFYRVESGRRPLPLQATGGARGAMRLVADSIGVFAPASVAESLAGAEALLFAPRPDARPEGVLATGSRSRVERAAFAGQRSAPPLFGSLFDGLDVSNTAGAAAVRNDATPERVPPIARAPFIAGFLAAGAGAVIRTEATTVADGRLARRRAPSLESVEARLGRQLPVRLSTTAMPASAKRAEQTLVAPAAHLVPRTAAAGATASFAGGPLGHRHLNAMVGGLSTGQLDPTPRSASRGRAAAVRAEDPSTLVRSGDVVVLQSPDALIDTATAAGARPSLRVKGTARVTVLGADGSAVSDSLVTDGHLRLPPGFAVVAVQPDALDPAGTELDRDGLAGWHARSRVVQIGTHAAIAPGAVVTIDGAPLGTGAVSWRDAGELTHGAAAVTTRFARPVTVLIVALGSCDAARADGLELVLAGASVATDRAGRSKDPIVVHLGATAVLVYELDVAAARAANSGVVARVRAGADWTVVAMLGADGDATAIARRLSTRGVASVAAKLLATNGPGASLSWRPAKNPRGARDGRR